MNRVLVLQGAGQRGGAERVLLALLRRLPARGIEPTVAAFCEGPFLDELRDAGIPVITAAAPFRLRRPDRVRTAIAEAAEIAFGSGAQTILANGEKMALVGRWAARSVRRPGVAWLHDAPARSVGALGLQAALRLSPPGPVVVPSRWMAEAFRRRLGIRAEVVPHGVDVGGVTPVDIRTESGWPAGSVVVAHIARLQRWKGAEVFLRAAAQVAARVPEARFAVVGGALYGRERDYAARLPRLAAELGLDGRVRFTGHREDALGIIAAADATVHASLRGEPFGLVVAEAMALGRAVVASRCGAPVELVDHGRTGLLAAPGDPDALAAAMQTLVVDPGLRRRLGVAAAAEAGRRWTTEAMADRFGELLGRDAAGDSAVVAAVVAAAPGRVRS